MSFELSDRDRSALRRSTTIAARLGEDTYSDALPAMIATVMVGAAIQALATRVPVTDTQRLAIELSAICDALAPAPAEDGLTAINVNDLVTRFCEAGEGVLTKHLTPTQISDVMQMLAV